MQRKYRAMLLASSLFVAGPLWAAAEPTAWEDLQSNGTTVPVRAAGGDIQCASYDQLECLWGTKAAQLQSSKLRPLVCGDMHKELKGSDGYSEPGHWCELAHSQLLEVKDLRHILMEHEAEEIERRHHRDRRSLNPSSVHLVDRDPQTGNALFRGNLPVADGTDQYDAIVQAMRNADSSLPPALNLIVYSLLNDLLPAERMYLMAERQYWDHHADQGLLINHPILGSVTSPNFYSEGKRKDLERHPSPGHLGQLVEEMGAQMKAKNDGVPKVMFVHCSAGKDRTGEVIAAYRMRYQGLSYRDALADAEKVAGRKISTFSRNGLQWYAYYLTDYLGISTVGPIR